MQCKIKILNVQNLQQKTKRRLKINWRYKISGVPVKIQRKKPEGNSRGEGETRKDQYVTYKPS